MGFSPQLQGNWNWIDIDTVPPSWFIASAVQLAMVSAAEGNREFVADPAAERARLSKAEMMRIARHAPTD